MTQPVQPAEPTTVQPVQPVQPQQPPAQPANPAVPPWERDGTPFDAARAWQLIQNKDADNERLKTRVGALEPLEVAAKAAEEANKTELQKAQDALAASQREAQDARLALLRRDVASREGKVLPAVLVDVLKGSTKEELEAHADALLAGLPQAPAAQSGTGTTPVAALRPGALPTPPPTSIDDQINAATAAGDWQTVIALKQAKAKAQNQR